MILLVILIYSWIDLYIHVHVHISAEKKTTYILHNSWIPSPDFYHFSKSCSIFLNSVFKNSNCIQTRIIANLLLITYIFILHVQSHDPFFRTICTLYMSFILKKNRKKFCSKAASNNALVHICIMIL